MTYPADEITLTGLRAHGFHGVHPEERRVGQEFVVDVTMTVDTRRAAASDDVTDTVHYGQVAEAVAAIVAGDPVDLLETLCARIADALFAFPPVDAVRVTVHKPSAPISVAFGDVSVTIQRERDR